MEKENKKISEEIKQKIPVHALGKITGEKEKQK